MEHISSTLRTLLIFCIVTAAAATGYYFFFLEIREINEVASRLESEIDTTIQKKVELRALHEVVENTQSDRNKLNTFFIAGNDVVDFLEIIEGLEENTGTNINLRSISEGTSETSNFSEELTLNVLVTGTWEGVYHFFTLLESLPYHTAIQQVQFIRSSSDGEGPPEWSGTFGFVVTRIK